jgi:hypothetical protein
MTKKQKADRIRELAKGANIPPLFHSRIEKARWQDVLYFFGECETEQAIEQECVKMQALCEKYRSMMEAAGLKLDFNEED